MSGLGGGDGRQQHGDRAVGTQDVGGPCARGVLLRPLGDVVVLMPMLTTTADEVERIVAALGAAVDEVCS